MVTLFGIKNFDKKAQAAGAAAVLLAIVMAMMIGYVLVVEPEERALLLGEDYDSSSDGSDAGEVSGEVLLEENPGDIEYLSQDEIEHTLASVNIFTSTESESLAEKESMYIKNSMFSEEKGTMTLVLDDVGLTSGVILSLRVGDTTGGRLKVNFNGESLYDGSASSGDNLNLNVPDHLLEEQNSVEFKVSSPGAKFWTSNEVTLENIIIVGELKNLDSQRASGSFQISETEYDNLEKLTFYFQPDCASGEDALLTVWLNSEEIYSATPSCSVQMDPIELGLEMVDIGQNTLEFYTDEGDYTVYGVKVVSELVDVDYPTYYFSLALEDFEEVEDDDKQIEVTLNFADDGDSKTGYVSVNGYKKSFDTTSTSYAFDASSYVETGNNAVKIIPTTSLEVRELLVEIGN